MVVIQTDLARGASNGGFPFHDRGGPYGRAKGAKRVVAGDVTRLPVTHLTQQGVTDRLELALVDRGVTAAPARDLGREHELQVRRAG